MQASVDIFFKVKCTTSPQTCQAVPKLIKYTFKSLNLSFGSHEVPCPASPLLIGEGDRDRKRTPEQGGRLPATAWMRRTGEDGADCSIACAR